MVWFQGVSKDDGNGQELRCSHISLVFRTHLKISLGDDIKTKEHGLGKTDWSSESQLTYLPSLNHSFFFFFLVY